jgi:hypothetical protein
MVLRAHDCATSSPVFHWQCAMSVCYDMMVGVGPHAYGTGAVWCSMLSTGYLLITHTATTVSQQCNSAEVRLHTPLAPAHMRQDLQVVQHSTVQPCRDTSG